MKTILVKLKGVEYQMPASFAVSKLVTEHVGDPLTLALLSHKQGSVPFDSAQVVKLIHIGAKAAGCSLSEEQVGEEIFDVGLIDFVTIAGAYVGAFVSGGPDKPIPLGKVSKK